MHKLTYEKFLFYTLWALFIISLGQVIFCLLHSGHIIFDDLEHLHASYFVSLGDVPYRDFFEHHHPLLWYVLAPVISIMPHNTVTALYIGRFISFGVSLIGGYFIYKIEKRFIGGTLCALFCLVFYFWGINDISSAGLFHIKPDIYQRCCFFAGLYYLFCYFRYQKFLHFQLCAVLFTLAFLFLQTAVFYVAPLAVPVFYFLYKNPQKWLDFAKAAVLPLLILLVCVAIFWHFDMLIPYFETNWLLNSIYTSIWRLSRVSITKFTVMIDMFLVAIAAITFLIVRRKVNIYTASLICCFIFEFVIRTFFVTNFIYYFTWLSIYAAMLSAPVLAKMSLKCSGVFVLFAAVWLIHFCSNIFYIDKKEFDILEKYIPQTGGETVFSQVFENRHSYYWMYPITEGVDNMSFNRFPEFNVNEIYQQKKSPVLLYPPLKRADYYAIRRILKPTPEQEEIFSHHFIDDFVKENYEEIDDQIFIRKDLLPTQRDKQ